MTMTTRLKPYALLLVLALIFFIDLVLHPTQVLYSDHSDILALHLPDKIFLCHSFHETGELPLWCPYRFAGVPFIHDFQVGAYYPPHWVLLALPEEYIGAGLSWLVVFHVVVAGWTMYAYARFRGLGETGAFIAATGFMFSGKLLLHVLAGGHFNMLMIAWLPLAAMLLESGLNRAGEGAWLSAIARAMWAGAVFGLLVLTAYPYVTLHAGLMLALWTLVAAWQRAGVWRWLLLGGIASLTAMLLGAVQLLPAIEAARLATRGGAFTNPFSESLWPLVFLTGPSLIREPPTLMWEVRGGFGVLWVAVAALAPLTARGRVRLETAVCGVLILLALGGIVVLYWIPGVAMFRLPSRIFLVATFPVAFLAGVTTDALWRNGVGFERIHPIFFKIVRRVLFLVATGFVLALVGKNLRLHPYWATLLVTLPVMGWLLKRAVTSGSCAPLAFRAHLHWLWCACLLLDLWGIVWPEVRVKSMEEIYPTSPAVEYLAAHGHDGRVLDLDQHAAVDREDERVASIGLVPPTTHSSVPICSPLGYGAPMATMLGIEALRGFNPMDVQRYKEYLQLMTDQDGPIRPLDPKSTFGFPSIGNFRPVNWNLADLLGVRYLLVGRGEHDIAMTDPDNRWQATTEDPEPRAFTISEGGIVSLDAFTLYRTDTAFPRAFVVGDAAPLPERPELLSALKQTAFRQHVLLEGVPDDSLEHGSGYRAAIISEYEPNRVRIDVPPGPAGYLVLADVWYPGWHVTVDGHETSCLRADYLFRAVELDDGPHEVEFRFRPAWYEGGRWISGATVLVLLLTTLLCLWVRPSLARRANHKMEEHAVCTSGQPSRRLGV
jgi:hypothetical protein